MTIAQRLSEIRDQIASACARSGRKESEVHLLAVSKLQPASLVEEAYNLGIRDFGENYVQELQEKRMQLSHLKEIRWHLIGHLQTNKVKQAVEVADYFHGLDSEKIVREAAKRLKAAKAPWPVFVEVNFEGESSKSGVAPDAVAKVVSAIRSEKTLQLLGLMCIPEPKSSKEAMRASFQKLAHLAKAVGVEKLSMGMSEDFEIAIEEGAHWVRVGRKLFGERAQPR